MSSERHRDALAAAEQLAHGGDFRGAIDLLMDANRVAASEEVELRLVELRARAFSSVEPAGAADWPPRPATAATAGIPEIAVESLDGDSIRDGIVGHGALRVNGLVSPACVAELVAGIDAALEAADGIGRSGSALPWFHPFPSDPDDADTKYERSFVFHGGGIWTADSPRMLFKVLGALEEVGLIAAIRDYFGEAAAVSLKKSTLRVVSPEGDSNWHQDGAFLGDDIRACNLWLALSPCGVDAPTLDVVPRRFDRLVETGTGGAYFDWSVGEETVAEVAGSDGVVRMTFEAGDALLFDDLFLHRTGLGPTMTEPRYAIESWFFARTGYPMDQVPLLV